jgi:hypothetical protein
MERRFLSFAINGEAFRSVIVVDVTDIGRLDLKIWNSRRNTKYFSAIAELYGCN